MADEPETGIPVADLPGIARAETNASPRKGGVTITEDGVYHRGVLIFGFRREHVVLNDAVLRTARQYNSVEPRPQVLSNRTLSLAATAMLGTITASDQVGDAYDLPDDGAAAVRRVQRGDAVDMPNDDHGAYEPRFNVGGLL